MARAGGFTAEKPADADVKGLFETSEIAAALSSQLGYAVTKFTVESYATQVVAGLNYSLTGTVEGGSAPAKVTVVAYKPLPHTGDPIEIKSVTVA